VPSAGECLNRKPLAEQTISHKSLLPWCLYKELENFIDCGLISQQSWLLGSASGPTAHPHTRRNLPTENFWYDHRTLMGRTNKPEPRRCVVIQAAAWCRIYRNERPYQNGGLAKKLTSERLEW